MDWGWIVLIVLLGPPALLLLLFLLLSFVPLKLRLHASSTPRALDYALAYGPFALYPGLHQNLARYRRGFGRPLYIISRPLIWLFIGIWWVLKAVTWPFRMVLRLLRRRRVVPEPGRVEVGPAAGGTVFEFEGDDEGEGAASAAPVWKDDEPEAGGITGDNGTAAPATEFPGDELYGESPQSGRDAGDRLAEKRPGRKFLRRPHLPSFAKLRENITRLRTLYRKYGRTGKRALRAMLLFLQESLRIFAFRRLDLSWSIGGDPAALGQILGWHYTLTGSLNPAMQRHLHFVPDWDSQELAPSGQADLVLYLWPYRMIPAFVRLLFRMPWWGLIRIAREQILQR